MTAQCHLGKVLHFLSDPATDGDQAFEYFDDGALLIEDGLVCAVGTAQSITSMLPSTAERVNHANALIVPGFIDTHIHYPQIDIIGAHGEQLLEWLERYVFPAEAKFADRTHANEVAARFMSELLRNGTTTALVFGTVHPQSVDAFFEAAEAHNMRMIAGKVLMDRNAPENLCDTPELAYTQSKALIERWHNRGRQRYAVTPRFAPTSSPAQLAAAGRLLQEFPDVYMHTHMSENVNEVAWVEALFPEHEHYLHTYDDAGLLGRRSIFAHCIHLNDNEWRRLADTQSNIAFCPTSNLFLGSGLFSLQQARKHGVKTGLGTDVGAGTSFSLLQTMNEAYKVQQLQGQTLQPLESFYLATLGGARTLDLDALIGNFLPGKEADFAVLDLAPTPLLAKRLTLCTSLRETLFVLSTLGDDRCVRETWIMGEQRHRRARQTNT